VRCRVLRPCFVAGRRRRPGDLIDVLAAEALLLVRDHAAEIAGGAGTNPIRVRGA
jgi:hypothetical protein